MEEFTETVLKRKFSELNDAKRTIKTLALWLIHHCMHHKTVVQIWFDELRKATPNQKLTFIYLADAIMKKSNEKCSDYKEEFKMVLGNALSHTYQEALEDDIIKQLRKIINVWEDRGLYNAIIIADLHTAMVKGKFEEEPPTKKRKVVTSEVWRDNKGRTPLHLAAKSLSASEVRELLNDGADINSQDLKGDTPLHIALRKRRRASVVITLLSANPILEIKDKYGMYPIHYAVDHRLAVVEMILERGCELNVQDIYKKTTPLHLAVQIISEEAARESNDDIGIVCEAEKIGIMKFLLNWYPRANLNIQDSSGRTPLHYSATALNFNAADIYTIILLLEQNDIDVNIQDIEGDTPLHLAIHGLNALQQLAELWHGTPGEFHVKREVVLYTPVCLLLIKGAKVNIVNKLGNTPLYNATKYQFSAIIQELLSHKADVDIQNALGETPLHVSLMRRDNLLITCSLLCLTRNINSRGVLDRTPLHLAAENQCGLLVKNIIRQGADVNARDKHGDTPLHLAMRRGNLGYRIVKELLYSGADITLENTKKESALTFAALSPDIYFSILLTAASKYLQIRFGGISLNVQLSQYVLQYLSRRDLFNTVIVFKPNFLSEIRAYD